MRPYPHHAADCKCAACLLELLAWVARNIDRIKDFTYSGDTYRQQVDMVVDHIYEKIKKRIG